MKAIRIVAILLVGLFVAALPCGLTTGVARADSWLKATKLTFNEETQVPGAVLSPGTYFFSLRDQRLELSPAQIWSGDRRQLFATFFVRNGDLVTTPRQDPVVWFAERPNGQPPAVKELFYPGDTYGMLFLYPNGYQLMSKTNNTPAPTQVASAATPQPAEEQPAAKQPEEAPPAPSSTEQSSAPAESNPPATNPSGESKNLPKTASDLPAVALAGVFFLAAGTLLSTRRRWRSA